MLDKERKFLLILLTILLLSIFTLIFYRNSDVDDNEPYKSENNKILIFVFNNDEIPIVDDKYDVILIKSDINELVQKIADNYQLYDAFIIYTSRENLTNIGSFLSFMLENIKKTFVVTTDLESSINYSEKYNIPEVVLLFEDTIFRASRARDLGNEIISHDYPILGEIDKKGNIRINKELILHASNDKFKPLFVKQDKKISIIKGDPNRDLFLVPSDVYIIEGYITNKNILDKIRELVEDKGAIAINVGNNKQTEKFIINSEMSPEATYAKTSVILSNVPHCDRAMADQLLGLSMRGEL
jgi:hypothetical protein